MVCDDDSKACAYGECSAYKNTKFNFNPPDDAVATRPITYTLWKLKRVPRVTTDDENAQSRQDLITVTKKEDMEPTMKYLIGNFMTCLKPFKWHAYNIMMQYAMYKSVWENLHQDECMLLADFSENDTCKYTNETQALHFGGPPWAIFSPYWSSQCGDRYHSFLHYLKIRATGPTSYKDQPKAHNRDDRGAESTGERNEM